MAHKLDRFKDQIELLKAAGDSVREIARKLSTEDESVAPSTVQHFISKQVNGNGESKETAQIDLALILARLDELDRKWEMEVMYARKWARAHFKFLADGIASWAEIIIGILLLHESLIVDFRPLFWGGAFFLGSGLWGIVAPARWGVAIERACFWLLPRALTPFLWAYDKFGDWRERRKKHGINDNANITNKAR